MVASPAGPCSQQFWLIADSCKVITVKPGRGCSESVLAVLTGCLAVPGCGRAPSMIGNTPLRLMHPKQTARQHTLRRVNTVTMVTTRTTAAVCRNSHRRTGPPGDLDRRSQQVQPARPVLAAAVAALRVAAAAAGTAAVRGVRVTAAAAAGGHLHRGLESLARRWKWLTKSTNPPADCKILRQIETAIWLV